MMKSYEEVNKDLFGNDLFGNDLYGNELGESSSNATGIYADVTTFEQNVESKLDVVIFLLKKLVEKNAMQDVNLIDKAMEESMRTNQSMSEDEQNNHKKEIRMAETKTELNNISSVARAIGEPVAIFSKKDAKVNIKSDVTVWVDREKDGFGKEVNRIKACTVSSKIDGKDRTSAEHAVNRKGIMHFSNDELKGELERYYQRLYDQGFGREK